jgi:protocatechuate 3,4-dioxygenase beta subunit
LIVSSTTKTTLAIAAAAAVGALGWWGVAEVRSRRARAEERSVESALPAAATVDADASPSRTVEPVPEATAVDRSALRAEPADSTDPRFGSLLVRVVWEKDGAPAPDRAISFIQWRAKPALRCVSRTSDSQGCVRLDRVEPGNVSFEADLGGEGSIDAVAGRLLEAKLSIPPGYVLRGRVVDPERRPVAGASIWLSDYFNYESGGVVTTSDADGRFEIPNVPEARYVGASAPGFAPADEVYVEELHAKLVAERERSSAMAKDGSATAPASSSSGADVAVDDVELVLAGVGAALKGVVLDPEGRPAAGASVTVVGQLPPPLETKFEATFRAIAPAHVVADERGEFVVEGLPVGPATVAVLHASSARHRVQAMLKAREATDVVVRLPGSGTVAGRVLDSAGAPVEKAEVRLDAEEYDFLDPEAKSDADGRFVLEGMPIGSRGIRAKHAAFGKATSPVLVEAGVTTTCELVLDAGLILSGRLVDERGAPVAGMGIEAKESQRSDAKRFWGQAKTDAEGRFRITNCPDAPLHVAVKKEFTDWQPLLAVADVRAGKDELHLVLDASEAVSIHGVLLAPDGGPALATLYPWLEGQTSTHGVASDPKSGAIDVQGLAPGRYRITLQGNDQPTRDLGVHDLAAGDRLDLGTIVLAAPGSLRLGWDETSAAPFQFAKVFAESKDGSGPGASVAFLGVDEARSGVPLAPGRYVVVAIGRENVALFSRRVEILAGQETTLTLEPAPGVACVIELDLPDELPDSALVRGWIESDGFLADLPIPFGRKLHAAARNQVVHLRPGRYRLFVDVAGKWSGRADLDVQEGATPRARIVVR